MHLKHLERFKLFLKKEKHIGEKIGYHLINFFVITTLSLSSVPIGLMKCDDDRRKALKKAMQGTKKQCRDKSARQIDLILL